MGTIAGNLFLWSNYHWERNGNEWSDPWGGSQNLWRYVILPRISKFIPAHNILEIAPGYGRWTEYLLPYCSGEYWGVDLTPKCIDVCKKEFVKSSYHWVVNDGKDLSFIPDNSLDFVFSFDSLVHVEIDVIDAYLKQLGRKMKVGSFGFIHHSNSKSIGGQKCKIEDEAGRSLSVGYEAVKILCEEANLICCSQEQLTWQTNRLIDCFTLFTKGGVKVEYRNITNPDFYSQSALIAKVASLYS